MWLLDINQIDVFVSGIENTKNGDILSDVLSRIFTKPRRQCAGRVLHDFSLNLDRDKVGPILGPAKRPALGNRPICHSKRSAPQVFGGPKRRATSNPGKCRGRGPPSPLHDGFCSGKGGVGWGVPLAGWAHIRSGLGIIMGQPRRLVFAQQTGDIWPECGRCIPDRPSDLRAQNDRHHRGSCPKKGRY